MHRKDNSFSVCVMLGYGTYTRNHIDFGINWTDWRMRGGDGLCFRNDFCHFGLPAVLLRQTGNLQRHIESDLSIVSVASVTE
jgi:hypothetical protein